MDYENEKARVKKTTHRIICVSMTSTSGGEEDIDEEHRLQLPHLLQQQQFQQDEESILRGHISPPHSPRSSFVGNAGFPAYLSDSTTAVHPVAAAAAAKASKFRRQSSLGDTSVHSSTAASTGTNNTTTSPPRKERRKGKGVSWKKQPSAANTNNKSNNRRSSKRNSNAAAAAAAAEEDDQKPRSRPSHQERNNQLHHFRQNQQLQQQQQQHQQYQWNQVSNVGGPEPIYPVPPAAAAGGGAAAAPMMPAMTPIHESLDSRGEQSVTASLIGTVDEPSVLAAGSVLPAAVAFIERS
jgi:hypothetical protein